MKILVTAFDAFGGESINPTERALQQLPDRIGDAELIKLVIPTKFGESLRRAIEAAEGSAVDAIVCLGQAGGRAHITPERVAINVMDADIPDNAGYQPVDVSVVEGGSGGIFLYAAGKGNGCGNGGYSGAVVEYGRDFCV